jgi:hypothetical protein
VFFVSAVLRGLPLYVPVLCPSKIYAPYVAADTEFWGSQMQKSIAAVMVPSHRFLKIRTILALCVVNFTGER